jgi:hypothetical protein
MREVINPVMRKIYESVYRTNERILYLGSIFPFEKEFTRKISEANSFNMDLHTHTTESDGVNTPHYSVWKGIRRKLDGIGITDHDTCEHDPICKYLQEKCKKHNFVVVSGTEYTTTIELEKDKAGLAHIVGLRPNYKATKEELKLIERTKEIKKPYNFITCTLNSGRNNVLPSEEVIETLLEQGNVVVIPHYWTQHGVRNRIVDLLENKRYGEVCVEIYNPRAGLMPKKIPAIVVRHGNLVANSDTHYARLTIGDASTIFDKVDVLGSDGKPSIDKIFEAMRKNRTTPYLVPINSFARNADKLRFLHALHDGRSFLEYFDDDKRICADITNKSLSGKEIEESLEDHVTVPED